MMFLLTLGDLRLNEDDVWFELCRAYSFQHLSQKVKLNGVKVESTRQFVEQVKMVCFYIGEQINNLQVK